MLYRSPLASYSFSSSAGTNLHVCYKDNSGNIKQSFFNQKSGWHASPNGIVGNANLNSGLAITGWGNGNEERVYYIGEDDKIVERCWSGDKSPWYEGELTGKFTAAHYSNLAAVSYQVNGTLCIRVYYQDKDNIIRELCRNGSEAWFPGYSFPAAVVGSSISSTYVAGATWSHYVYYQKPNTKFVEFISQNSTQWQVGGFKSQLVYDPGAYISIASYPNVNHCVFTIDRDNKLCVTEFNTPKWAATKQLTVAVPFSSAAATPVVGFLPSVRVYIQIVPGQIAEWGTNDGKTYSLMANPLPTK